MLVHVVSKNGHEMRREGAGVAAQTKVPALLRLKISGESRGQGRMKGQRESVPCIEAGVGFPHAWQRDM